MSIFKKTKDFYTKKYETSLQLHKQGKSISEIAKMLNISYSCAYHWINGLRKPKKDIITKFQNYLKKKGPTPVISIEKKFPKHNEIYNKAKKRNKQIKRYKTTKSRTLGKNSVWYYLAGQENELKERILKMIRNYEQLKQEFNKKR